MFDTLGAGLDEAEWNDASRVLEFEQKINAHPESKKKSEKGRLNARQDALILEVAINNGLKLVTGDKALFDVATAEGVISIHIPNQSNDLPKKFIAATLLAE